MGDKGRLEVIAGPMFSGKSEELLRRIRRAEIAKQPVIVFKPSIENRSEGIHTHSGWGHHSPVHPIHYATSIYNFIEISENKGEHHIICIDEAQFFDSQIIEVVQKLVDDGHRVIVSGLDQDFRELPFGPMPDLLAMADLVVKLKAVCDKCGEDAGTTQRLIDGKPASYSGDTILVGAKDSYEARCRNCHERG